MYMTTMRMTPLSTANQFKEMTRNHAVFFAELDPKLVGGHRREKLRSDLLKEICAGYSRLMSMHITTYPGWLTTLSMCALLKGVYIGD